ncbi:helix-turn-helix domain-containing protein [Devosia sp. D6-9]|nr:helix-turn-helix domain-containing protein [Devosia sp. D6-9]
MNQPHEICVALRSYRIKARIRQQVIAQALGVAQSQISRWESGREIPRPHNIEAIRLLLWGDAATPLQSLIYFVRTSALPLVLIDQSRQLLARGLPFQVPGNDLERFGWVFDEATNPELREAHGPYREALADPRGIVGLELRVPFEYQGEPWIGISHKTIYAIDGKPICLADIRFMRAANGNQLSRPTMRRLPANHPADALSSLARREH